MNDELLAEFLDEGRVLAVQASKDLAVLARAPDRAALDRCFRAVHTLKGSAGLFNLPPMSRLLHAAEDQLGALRQGRDGDERLFAALIDALDQVDRWLDDLERTGLLPEGAAEAGARLTAALTGQGADAAPLLPTAPEGAVAIRYVPRPDAYFAGDDPVAIIRGVPGLTRLDIAAREPFGDLAAYDPFACNLVIEAVSSAPRDAVAEALRWVKDQVDLSVAAVSPAAAPTDIDVEGGARTVRVDAVRLDRLAELAGELVVAKTGLGDLAADVERLPGGHAVAQTLRARRAHLDRLVSELHGAVGQARLTPLGPLLDRFPRQARDMARALGKSVAFNVEGGDIRVDKAVVDGLFEPLLHVLRNALDHGLERPQARLALGKPETGAVSLAARTVGEQAVIEVRDDGAGIDPERIKALAVERGLVAADVANLLDDRGALDLIFLRGFSTAGAISQVSGRGVGMDAVRTAIARLGGRVEIDGRVGEGTTVRFLLPISTVLTKIMVVTCGDELYGLPLEDVAETTRVDIDRIIPVRAGEAFQLRDRVVPLVRLGALVGADDRADRLETRRVVVVRVADEWVGLAVDAIVERMDAAVRPMTGLLSGARGVAGSTMLASGAVLMVLDLQALLR